MNTNTQTLSNLVRTLFQKKRFLAKAALDSGAAEANEGKKK